MAEWRKWAASVASSLDEQTRRQSAAERARSTREARKRWRADRQRDAEAARQQASEELERLHVCGLITESEYKNRRAELLGM